MDGDMAFVTTGVQTFLGDLTTLMEEDIMNLEVRPTHAILAHPHVPIMHKRKMVITSTAYHHFSRLKCVSIDMCLFPIDLLNHFRISLYCHDEKIIP